MCFYNVKGKTPLRQYAQLGPTTPVTPRTNPNRIGVTASGGSTRFHLGLPTGRRSLSADRASSIGSKSKKDMRPLLDKAYQAQMLAKIDEYFIKNQESSMLNGNKSLKPITLKMFVALSAYLLKALDIKQSLTAINYVEELPKIAKKLQYPGVVAKSWLKTANAMHSWPNVLGWLCWLVEVCEVKKVAFEEYSLNKLPFVGTPIQAELHKKKFFAMMSFYQAWNEEKLEEEEALVEKYLMQLEHQQGITDEDFSKAESELQNKTRRLQAATDEANKISDEVERLREVLLSLQEEEAMQLHEIKSKKEYIKATNAEIELMEEECDTLREQIDLQTVQRDELLLHIQNQPMSKYERDEILEKCNEKKNFMDQFDEHLQDIKKETESLDMELASINNTLNKSVLTYNKEIFMNLGTDTGIDLNELKMPESGVLRPQYIDVLNTKAKLLSATKDFIKEQLVERKSSIEIYHNERESLQERLQILQDNSNDIGEEVKKRKRNISKIKADCKDEESRLREQIKILQNDIKEIQESMPNCQQITYEVEELKDKLDAVQRKKLYIEESAKIFFAKFYEILGNHRNELYDILTNIESDTDT